MGLLLSIGSMIIFVISYLLVFDAFFIRRFRPLQTAAVALIWGIVSFAILQSGLASAYALINPIMVILEPLELLIFLLILYRGSRCLRVLLAMAYSAIAYSLSTLLRLGAMSIAHCSLEELVSNRMAYTGLLLFFHAIVLFLSFSVYYFHKPISFSPSRWVLILLCVLCSVLTLAAYFIFFTAYGHSLANPASGTVNLYLVMAILAITIFVNMLLIIVAHCFQQNAQDQANLLTLTERLNAQAEYAERLTSIYEKQSRMQDELSRQLSVLSGLIKEKDNQAALDYLDRMQQVQKSSLSPTSHRVIDTLLNEKLQLAQSQGIRVDFRINDLDTMKINQSDLLVVLTSLIDNAIEACTKMDAAHRWMQIILEHDPDSVFFDDSVYIAVRNFSHPVNVIDYRVIPARRDRVPRGSGLTIVHRMLGKYNAVYSVIYEEDSFMYLIDWPNISI